MSTELMTATNDSGTISMTGFYRDGKPRYQITVVSKERHCRPDAVYLEVDAETIANMQQCVNHYETPKI